MDSKAFRDIAREQYETPSSGNIEIDDDAEVTQSDVGCWVAAWVFVRDEDMEESDDASGD